MANDKTISATGASELALKLAAKVSDQTMQDAEIILDAKEDDRRGPLVLAIDFKRDFTPTELASFPVVGSTEGNNPDVTKVPKEMANGGTREVNHYWYRHDFAPNTHLGITLAETIKDLSDKKKDTNNADPDDVALSLSRAQARLDAWGTRCERAFAYIQQCERWEAIADKVKYHLTMQRAVDFNGDLVTDDKGQPVMEVSKSPKPIKMWDATPNGKEIKFISLTSFLAFDVNEAAKNGGDWQALHATVGGDGETPKVKPITEVTLGRLADIIEHPEPEPPAVDTLGFEIVARETCGAKNAASLPAGISKSSQQAARGGKR